MRKNEGEERLKEEGGKDEEIGHEKRKLGRVLREEKKMGCKRVDKREGKLKGKGGGEMNENRGEGRQGWRKRERGRERRKGEEG